MRDAQVKHDREGMGLGKMLQKGRGAGMRLEGSLPTAIDIHVIPA